MKKIAWADVSHHYLKSGISVRVGTGDRSHRHGSPEYIDHPFNIDTYRNYGGSVPESMTFSCRPMLRPLGDITKEECAEFYTLATGLAAHGINRILRRTDKSILSQVWFEKLRKAKVIILDFANTPTSFGLDSSYAIFNWSCAKGFDVFGLLENGQATTIERQPCEVTP